MTLLRKYPGILKFMILFLLIFLIVIFVFRNSLYPVFFSLAEARAVNKGGYIVNQIIAREIENIEYEDLITYEKNNEGKIALMQPNIREINRFSSKLSMNIKNNLNEMRFNNGIPNANYRFRSSKKYKQSEVFASCDSERICMEGRANRKAI